MTKYITSLILASGHSRRFNGPIIKQLYKINDLMIIEYSIKAMNQLRDIVIVTNKECFKKIYNLHIIISDGNEREESILYGIKLISNIFGILDINVLFIN